MGSSVSREKEEEVELQKVEEQWLEDKLSLRPRFKRSAQLKPRMGSLISKDGIVDNEQYADDEQPRKLPSPLEIHKKEDEQFLEDKLPHGLHGRNSQCTAYSTLRGPLLEALLPLRSLLKRLKKSFLTFENCLICHGFEHNRTSLLLKALCQESLDICRICVEWHSSRWIFIKYDNDKNLKDEMSLIVNVLMQLAGIDNLLSSALAKPEKSQFNREWLETLHDSFDKLNATYPFWDEDTVEADDSQGSSSMSDVDVPKLEECVGNSSSTVSDEEPEELEDKLKKKDREFREDLARREAAQMEEINKIRRERKEMERGMNI